jgi:hypothetical protein
MQVVAALLHIVPPARLLGGQEAALLNLRANTATSPKE